MADKARVKKYYRTKYGFVSRIYNNQKSHSKARGHRQPEYSQEELRDWLFSQQLFHELFSEYKNSGFKKYISPSVNRKCNDIHYCMSNIELMTWEENKNLGHVDRKAGRDSTSMAINQLDTEGNIVAEHSSIMAAARAMGKIRATAIGEALAGRNKSAYGYVWEYKG